MDALKKYDKFLKDQGTTLEEDDLTRSIIADYFREEILRKRWEGILQEQYDYKLDPPNDSVGLPSNLVGKNSGDIPGPSKSNGTRKIRPFIIAAIAGIAATMLIFFYMNLTSDAVQLSPVDQLLAEHYNKPFTRDALKGPSATIALRSEAYGHYQKQDYAKTIPLLEEVIANGPLEQEDYFFLGLSYLYNDQPLKAVTPIKTILNRPANNYTDVATWYLALALTDAGSYEEARVYLTQISKWTGNSGKREMATDAKALLTEIEGMD